MQVNVLYYCICSDGRVKFRYTYCITVYAQIQEQNAGKCIILLYSLRWESRIQVNELY
jgi:hypothetical protein